MLTEFTIKNFRALDDVTLTNLARVNLIGGKNAVGKTSVLEAIWTFGTPTRPDIGYRVTNFRGVNSFSDSDVFRDLFSSMDINTQIELIGKGDKRLSTRELTISLRELRGTIEPFRNGSDAHQNEQYRTPRSIGAHEMVFDYVDEDGKKYQTSGIWAEETAVLPIIPVAGVTRGVYVQPRHELVQHQMFFITPKIRSSPDDISNRFGQLRLEGRQADAIEFIKAVGPDINELIPIKLGDEVMLHASLSNQKRLMPVNMLGEGGFKSLEIALAIASARNGTVLIDEIENGLHHSALKQLFLRLHGLAKEYNVQVFATTHSWECVKAAHEALGPVGDEFAYHRIGTRHGTARFVHYDEEMLQVAFETGWDIR